MKKRGGARWVEKNSPKIHVNQLGYLPHGPKTAVLRSTSRVPLEVRLEGPGGVIWRGTTVPFGLDTASGDPVHRIDFSSVTAEGRDLKLVTPEGASFPFSISPELYDRLPFEAAKYFYHNRSGVPIVVPYVPSSIWSRPAGHLSDRSVGCWPQSACSYRLDVSGGWYDAGDYGKYVVNGGIAVWTLLALYERTVAFGGDVGPFSDGALNIPESGNGVPDLLDEARVELEFLMKMQVPRGHEHAGMAHHKIHDHSWSALAIEPAPETSSRGIHPPSTAATLNLAATMAQAARVYQPFDAEFARRALEVARSAFVAAENEPAKFASPNDKAGGGPYDDQDVSDEFFWAAVELFVTTGEATYAELYEKNPHASAFPTVLRRKDGSLDGSGVSGSMSWQSTAALGWISLAVASPPRDAKEQQESRSAIAKAADRYLQIEGTEGYGQPMAAGPGDQYPWGSNSFVANNLIVLALAYDFTKDPRFIKGVIEGADYLFGKNPLHQSYVSGYGSVPFENPHHRFWAHSLNREYPPPPPGVLAGGPNSGLEDPRTKRSGLSQETPPAKCYVDHIDAYSVNEVAINWNAPLTWVGAILREHSRAQNL